MAHNDWSRGGYGGRYGTDYTDRRDRWRWVGRGGPNRAGRYAGARSRNAERAGWRGWNQGWYGGEYGEAGWRGRYDPGERGYPAAGYEETGYGRGGVSGDRRGAHAGRESGPLSRGYYGRSEFGRWGGYGGERTAGRGAGHHDVHERGAIGHGDLGIGRGSSRWQSAPYGGEYGW